jgi:hypothetical protein
LSSGAGQGTLRFMNESKPPAPARGWRRVLRLLGLAAILVVAAIGARVAYALRDRHPGYALELNLDGAPSVANPRPLQVGFGRVKINPDLSDPKRPVWLAGFSQHRAATAQHDDLWAVAVVLDDGYRRVGLVVLDAIGLFHDEVVEVRRRLRPEWRLDYAVVCTTHNHSTPDLMGLWGPNILHTGVDPRYREQVIDGAARAIGEAAAARQPARVAFHQIAVPPQGLVADTRPPEVFDCDLRVMHFTRTDTGATIGTVVGWGNHPETVWSRNTEITADYCGYLRDELGKGVQVGGRTVAAGLGGIHLFVNGAVGGLMTTPPRVTVRDPYLERDFGPPSHDKARAVARQLVSRLLPWLGATNRVGAVYAPLAVRARTFEVPLDNIAFAVAPLLGLIDRGQSHWMRLRTEAALIRFGSASLACVPGEIYPELVNGGVVRAPGGDFDIDPLEVPPVRELMPGQYKFVLGLANDEVGYIIPKSEWDRRPPYLFGARERPYGEINSVGPDVTGCLHCVLRELCQTPAREAAPPGGN